MPQGNAGFCKKDDREKAAEPGIIGGWMKIFYYIRRFWEIPWGEKKFLFKCIVIILLVRIITFLCPIKYYQNIDRLIKFKKNLKGPIDCSWVALIKKSIYRIGLILPITNNCLVKSFSCKIMLKSYGIKSSIVFSLNKAVNNQLLAHAYLVINDDQKWLNLKNYRDLYSL
jgi:hypothetical protein